MFTFILSYPFFFVYFFSIAPDISGNVLTSTDFGGNLTSYTYDELDRLISKKTADGTVSYSYTTDGKLETVKDSNGTTKYTYDSMDGLKKVVYPDGKYVEYGYDDSCRLTSVKTAYGTTAYEYDKLDRLLRVVDRNGYATVYEYDENGNRSAVRYANGIVISYKYDEVNRLISEKALDKQDGLVAQYEYTLGAAGERTKVKELDRTVEYTYDALYRLTGEKITAADGTVTEYTYAYDKVSNRTLKTENGAKTAYTYNAINQLVKENDITYKYDEAGNLISTVSSGKSATYTYNAENKLIKAIVKEGNIETVEEYTYDYAGNRTSKKTGTETVKYLNDNSVLTNVIAELDADDNELCYYTIGADLISQERNGKTSLYLYDGHGSVRGLIDENSKVTDTYNYDAFGNLLDKTGTTVNNYLYCGEQFDSATGLYYLRARYMNPATGTFITQDTYSGTIFDPTSLHKYLYANANPVMYVDPSGYFGLTDVVCSNAIIDTLFYGTSAGLINVGLNLIRELRAAERYGTTVDFGYVITMSFTEGFLMGAFFGTCGMLAHSLNSALIYAALGGSSFIFASMSLAQAEADRSNGDYDLMAFDLLFATGGFLGAKHCFDNAYQAATASNTAKTSTNTSASNTNTAKSSSNTSTNEPKRGTLSNVEARKWYLEQEGKIPELIDKSLTLEEQAKQAFTLRNQYRTQARELMADRQAAEALYKSDPNMTWEEIVNKYKSKGFSGDELYQEIINSSQRSRQSVNESLGLGAKH